jgi:hypothetical protein
MGPSKYFDQLAIGLSALCIVHCLAVPVAVAMLPLAALGFGADAHFHAVMLWLVVPTSIAGFTIGFRIHRAWQIVATGAVGVAVITLAALWGHAAWPVATEVAVSVAGSLALALAHWRNFREVRRLHRHL